MKSSPGIIRKLFIAYRLERVQAGEMAMQSYLGKILDELTSLKPNPENEARIRFLFIESNNTTDRIKSLQDKKKKLYFKLL